MAISVEQNDSGEVPKISPKLISKSADTEILECRTTKKEAEAEQKRLLHLPAERKKSSPYLRCLFEKALTLVICR